MGRGKGHANGCVWGMGGEAGDANLSRAPWGAQLFIWSARNALAFSDGGSVPEFTWRSCGEVRARDLKYISKDRLLLQIRVAIQVCAFFLFGCLYVRIAFINPICRCDYHVGRDCPISLPWLSKRADGIARPRPPIQGRRLGRRAAAHCSRNRCPITLVVSIVPTHPPTQRPTAENQT